MDRYMDRYCTVLYGSFSLSLSLSLSLSVRRFRALSACPAVSDDGDTRHLPCHRGGIGPALHYHRPRWDWILCPDVLCNRALHPERAPDRGARSSRASAASAANVLAPEAPL